MKKLPLLVLIASLGSGCAVGPNYKRPSVNVPDTYRGLTLEEETKNGGMFFKTSNFKT